MSPAVTVTAVEAAAVEATTVTAAVAAVSSAPHERIQGFAPNFSNFPILLRLLLITTLRIVLILMN